MKWQAPSASPPAPPAGSSEFLYYAPLATTTAAVLAYRAIQLWLPALLGSLAFVQLRMTLRKEAAPAVLCAPLAEPIETVRVPAPAG